MCVNFIRNNGTNCNVNNKNPVIIITINIFTKTHLCEILDFLLYFN